MIDDASSMPDEGWQSEYPDEDREIYPAAPLRFVAFEFTFPPVPALQDETAKREMYARLRRQFPIPAATPAAIGGFSVQLSPTGVSQPASLRAGSLARVPQLIGACTGRELPVSRAFEVPNRCSACI